MDFNQNTQPEQQNEQPSLQNGPEPEQQSSENADRNGNNAPYGNGSNAYNNNNYNSNHYYNNNSYYNGYNNNGYPYYNRDSYQLPNAEPGSSLASAAMILGIVSIVSCFTFTIYPAFVCGSIAVVLALLSKGQRPKLLNKAQTGITLAVIGLVLNTVLVVSSIVLLFTNPNVREEVNRTFQRTYGQTFDEMMEEIMEGNEDSY